MKGTETRELQKRREFWLMVCQMPRISVELDPRVAVALIAQVQIARRVQPQPDLLAQNAQTLAKGLIAKFPAPVAARMNRGWERPRITADNPPAAVPVTRAAPAAETVTPCDPPPTVRLCFQLCGKLLVAAGAILAWRTLVGTRRLFGRA
ncbi:MAG: hypothetical protein E6Q97_30410 [Desulfurellales bacterium]|nr:MAG: hypothetical protein E6Q97_30410 [Desulfurellales bacterium]